MMEPYVGQRLPVKKRAPDFRRRDPEAELRQPEIRREVVHVNRRHGHYTVYITFADGRGYGVSYKFVPGEGGEP